MGLLEIDNFLSESERRMISEYIESVEGRDTKYVHRKGIDERPDPIPLKELMNDKRVE